LNPATGAGVHEASKEGLKTLIDALDLTISLRMVSSTHPQLNACQLEQELPQLTCEDPITIRDDGLG